MSLLKDGLYEFLDRKNEEHALYYLGRAVREEEDETAIKYIEEICSSDMCISYTEENGIQKARMVTTCLNNLTFKNVALSRAISNIVNQHNNISVFASLQDIDPYERFLDITDQKFTDCSRPIQLMFSKISYARPGDRIYFHAKGDYAVDILQTINHEIIKWYPQSIIKVIFLDIDGVLNSKKDIYDLDLRTEYHMDLLQKIVQETKAKIVLSSTWRKEITLLKEVLIPKLEKRGLEIMSFTPVLSTDCRGDDIREWLNLASNPRHGYGVYKFAILDDHNDMCEFTETNLIQTNANVGLQPEDAQKCINLLNMNPSDAEIREYPNGEINIRKLLQKDYLWKTVFDN